MSAVVFAVCAIGLGVLHATYVYRREQAPPKLSNDTQLPLGRPVYFALWTLVLWLLCGRFIIVYWLLALVPYLIAKQMGKTLNVSTGAAR